MKKGLSVANFLLTFLPITVYVIIYNFMGDLIPVSWNEFGEETSFITKTFAVFIVPTLTLFASLLLFFTDRIRNNKDIFGISFEAFSTLVILTFVFVSLFPLYLINFDGGNRYDLMAYIMMAISFFVFVCGFIFPKFRFTGKYGFITPWTRASEKVFYKTQQVASASFVIGAFILFATTLFVHDYKMISLLAFILIMLIIMFIPLLYSKRSYENE